MYVDENWLGYVWMPNLERLPETEQEVENFEKWFPLDEPMPDDVKFHGLPLGAAPVIRWVFAPKKFPEPATSISTSGSLATARFPKTLRRQRSGPIGFRDGELPKRAHSVDDVIVTA